MYPGHTRLKTTEMKIKKLSLLVVLLAFAAAAQAQNRAVEFVDTNFAEALKKAGTENKVLFVDCYTDWCGPCKYLASQVFTDDRVADYINEHFISLKVDCEKGEGPELAKKYNVSGYPTLLFISPDGELINKIVGASSPDKFIDLVKEALDEENSLASKEKKYNDGQSDLPFLTDMFNTYKKVNDRSKVTEVGNKILSVVPEEELFTPEMWEVVSYHYISPYNSQWWDFIISNSDRYAEVIGKDKVAEKIGTVLHPYTFRYAIGMQQAADREEFAKIGQLIDTYRPSQYDAIRSFLRLAESRSFGTFEDYFKTVQEEFDGGLPLSEHFRVMANAFYYLYNNSDDGQKKELKKIIRDSYGQQNDHIKQSYDKLLDRFE